MKQCSDLHKGDFALIKFIPCEVLAAFVLDADRFVVKARNIVTGREFEVKVPPTERTELFTPTFKDYILVRSFPIHLLRTQAISLIIGVDAGWLT